MATKWVERRLEELGTIVGGATPSTKRADYYGGDIPWITPKDLSVFQGRYISRGERNITEAGLASCSAQLMPKNAVLFTSRAPIGYVAIAAESVCTNQGFKSVVANEKTDSLFLYYLLKYNKDAIEALGTGTTFKEVSGKTMKAVKVCVPETRETQRKIAAILSALDDKIELNRRINANLEQQAAAIFKSKFCDFDDNAGQMPSNWNISTFGEIAEVTSGKRPPMKQPEFSEDVNVPLVGASTIMGYTNNILYNEPILVIGRVGTHGVVQRFQTPCWPSDNTLVIKSEYYEYAFHFLKNVDYVNMNRGSTQPLITQTDLKNLLIVLPEKRVLKEFEKLTGTLMARWETNRAENEQLAAVRDALLPRLMSGEIDVSDVSL